MESYETINFANFTSKDHNFGKRTKTSDDKCIDGLTRNELSSQKPLKYYTSDFFHQSPCESSNLTNLSKGLNFSNGFGISTSEIDLDSKYRVGAPSNKKFIGDLGPLPLPTSASFAHGQGNVLIEDLSIRSRNDKTLKSCAPQDNAYYNRSFAIFPEGIIMNPLDNIEGIAPSFIQAGISTKGATQQKYKRGNN